MRFQINQRFVLIGSVFLISSCASQKVLTSPRSTKNNLPGTKVASVSGVTSETITQKSEPAAGPKNSMATAVSPISGRSEDIKAAPRVFEPVSNIPDANPKVVGAVLPLSGKNSSIGQHALNAIKMGLELSSPDNKLALVLFDSESNPDLAAKGARKLVLEDKVIALLGGFTAKEATSIAEQAELLKTPYIGFSQKSGLTSIGEHVFRNSLTPEMQVDKLVQHAFDKLGAKKFAVLFPNDSYGVEFSNIFWDHVLARGGAITGAQSYDPKETDFTDPVQKLVGTYYIEARLDEYKSRLEELKAQKEAAKKVEQKSSSKKSSRDNWTDENILTPIVDFDVLFVPDSSRALGQIMAFMKYNDVIEMNYLGTNIWNSPELPKRATSEKSGVYFVDAFDISASATEPHVFLKNYQDLHGEEAGLVEVQAFESAKIIKDQLLSGSDSRDELAENLRALGRSEGVTGELRMSSQREIERPIHVLTLNSGLVKKTE